MPPPPERLAEALTGRYAIERELGAGGMATVYLALDLRHGRQVALKVLRPELAAVIGAERFLAEIKTTAALAHPNILPLHDSGAADSFLFYVMPFMEGESLRDRLNREKQLPVADAVRIATEVAGALDYAHRHGVIHRDIKPENVLLHDGRALVADFGIALAASKASGTRMTETGMSLGTPHYMSPEQAMGDRDLDARSDVYALGAVTYEMLTGEPPFTGPTAQAIVAKVMSSRPEPVTTIRPTVPPGLEAAVLTALQKLPADRFASAAAFASALTAPSAAAPAGTREGVNRWKQLAAVLALMVVALAVLSIRMGLGTSDAAPAVFDVGFPDTAAMAFATPQTGFSVSPGGDFLVYTVKQADSTMLWYRSLVDGSAHPIPGTRGGTLPRVSPDGRRLAFLQFNRVLVTPLEGGQSRALVDGHGIRMIEWVSPTRLMATDDDDKLLRWLDPDAGQTSMSRIDYCNTVQWLDREQALLCGGTGYAYLIEPKAGTRRVVRAAAGGANDTGSAVVAGSDFRLISDRYLVYLSPDGDIRATTYDRPRRVAGRSVTLVSGVRREAFTGGGQWGLSGAGTLVYALGPDAEIGRMVRARPGAAAEPLPIEGGRFLRFDLSNDRRHFAAVLQGIDAHELRIYDLANGQGQVWLQAPFVGQPLWSPDGSQILVDVTDGGRTALVSGRPGSVRPLDTMLAIPQPNRSEFRVTPYDYPSDHLAFFTNFSNNLVLSVDPTRRAAPVDTLLRDAMFATLSPDGRRLAYFAISAGQLVVTPFPAREPRFPIAPGGDEPLWLSSTSLLYWVDRTWYQVRINPQTGEPVGRPEIWWTDPRFADTLGLSHRPSHDGGIIYKQGPAQTSAPFLRVVPNWVAQMKRAVDQANRQ